jgi:hypothetical protein
LGDKSIALVHMGDMTGPLEKGSESSGCGITVPLVGSWHTCSPECVPGGGGVVQAAC